MMRRTASFGLCLALLAIGSACSDQKDANTADDVEHRCGPKGDAERAAKTTGAAAKTGGKTAVEGVKTFGKSVGGFFSGGADEAEAEWKEGSDKTREAAKEGADETEQEANTDPCPTD